MMHTIQIQIVMLLKDTLRHIKNLITYLTEVGQGHGGSSREAPPPGAGGQAFVEKTQKQSREIL